MIYAVILSGGTGSRISGLSIPKQYYKIGSKMLISYCLETFSRMKEIDGIMIVADLAWHSAINCELKRMQCRTFLGFSEPGENRQLSVYNALQRLKTKVKADDLVIIHDGARPGVSAELLRRCIRAAEFADGSMPVLKMKDTVYYSENGNQISSLLKRECLFCGQAPEVFAFGKYLEANQCLSREQILQINGSSEPAIMAGMHIELVDGDEKNYKITTQADLNHFVEDQKGRKNV